MSIVRACAAGAAVLAVLAACTSVPQASARVLQVGPSRDMKMPSEAAAKVSDGDTVQIDPGEYFDCATWRANRITIEGMGDGVVITDKACSGKGLFITQGADITIRNLTLTRARVPDANGAGIRAEGANLTIDHVRFINNQDGILAADSPSSTIRIVNSDFERNGTCEKQCAHGIYINNVGLLHVENSRFYNQHEGHHIKSRAQRTELIGNTIEDGPEGTSSYLVDVPNGGALVIANNTMQKGPKATNHGTAIVIGEEGVTQRTRQIDVHGNKFSNDMPYETVFLRNVTAEEAQLVGNTFKGNKTTPLVGDGSVR